MTREEQIRKKAKELGQQYFPDSSNIWARSNVEACYVENACIEMAEWVDQHPQWIPVERELPPASCGVISDPVLVFIGNNTGWCGYIREGFYNHAAKEWSYMNRGRTHKVTHWMEIQPPRKEEGNQ